MARLPLSVVIPTYNRAHLVARSVRSALATLEPGDEVVVADDGSTDDTRGALAPFGDRVRHLVLPHRGAGATRNDGAAAARGPLVAFLDSDDEWFADKTLLQRRLHEAREDVLFSFSDFAVREEDGREERRFLPKWQERAWDLEQVLGPAVPYSSIAPLPAGREDFGVRIGDLFQAEMEENFVATFTLVVRKDLAGDALHFSPDLRTCDDWECFGRLARRGTAAYLDTETAWQNGHPGPRITRIDPLVFAQARLTVLDRVWGHDEAFQRAHGARYREVVTALELVRARRLLRAGRSTEAREALARAGHAPLSLRALAALPGPLVRGALRLLRGRGDDRDQ
ncbi:MAG: glycosyltransferase family 2 protein [Planctomycetes bacterium]|nr:glycosyltransferase family 2 protein [Planctomycetota bacterium]